MTEEMGATLLQVSVRLGRPRSYGKADVLPIQILPEFNPNKRICILQAEEITFFTQRSAVSSSTRVSWAKVAWQPKTAVYSVPSLVFSLVQGRS